MSVEGMWLLRSTDLGNPGQFLSPSVIILETGRLFGGDSAYFFVGDYVVTGGQIAGSVRTRTHTTTPGLTNVFGMTGPVDYTVDFSGLVNVEGISGVMQPRNMPGVRQDFILTKLEDLPG